VKIGGGDGGVGSQCRRRAAAASSAAPADHASPATDRLHGRPGDARRGPKTINR